MSPRRSFNHSKLTLLISRIGKLSSWMLISLNLLLLIILLHSLKKKHKSSKSLINSMKLSRKRLEREVIQTKVMMMRFLIFLEKNKLMNLTLVDSPWILSPRMSKYSTLFSLSLLSVQLSIMVITKLMTIPVNLRSRKRRTKIRRLSEGDINN